MNEYLYISNKYLHFYFIFTYILINTYIFIYIPGAGELPAQGGGGAHPLRGRAADKEVAAEAQSAGLDEGKPST